MIWRCLAILFFIKPVEALITYNIGTIVTQGSLAYENIRYAVDRWNSENSAHTEIELRIVAPVHSQNLEEKFCEILQHAVVAVVLQPHISKLDDTLAKSMCHHFKIPCLSVFSRNHEHSVSDFVTSLGPSRGLAATATSQFLEDLRWTSFLLAYQQDSDLEDLAPLIYTRSEGEIRRPTIRVRKLPNNTHDYEPFLKYVKNKLKQTNIIIHSYNITTLYNLLQQARGLNMTDSPFSYVFTNTDLSLLEDFLNNIYGHFHCNITGLQLVKNDPMMKTELALTSEAIGVIGSSLHRLQEIASPARPMSMLCDTRDEWRDGEKMNRAMRKLSLKHQLTGDVHFDTKGEREDLMFYGIGRINSQFVQVCFIFENILLNSQHV
ncbi:unnamed protein product [Auanema sp. JU1783]|nr:unnamed protein product [Auanema sp. JU1783]